MAIMHFFCNSTSLTAVMYAPRVRWLNCLEIYIRLLLWNKLLRQIVTVVPLLPNPPVPCNAPVFLWVFLPERAHCLYARVRACTVYARVQSLHFHGRVAEA